MPIDFDREGLLEGVTDQRQRESRLALLNGLCEAGATLEQLKRAVGEGRLAALPVEMVFTRGLRFTLREAMSEHNFDEGFVRRNYLALGLPAPGLDEPALDERDLESWRMLRRLFDAGVPEENILQMARLTGRTAAQLVELVLEVIVGSFLEPGETEGDFGLRFAKLATDLEPALGPLTERPVRLHLRERMRQEVISQAELDAGGLRNTREIGVCFADLVEFTQLSERLTSGELGNVTARLEALAAEVAEPPVRLIKLIGDAAMLVAPNVAALVEASRRLVEAADADDALPRLRAGIAAGPALNKGGDWYGRPVNLASRLTDVADPGAIVADEAVVQATREDQQWTLLERRPLKGIAEEVAVYELAANPEAQQGGVGN